MPPQLSVPARPEPTSPPCSPAAVREVEMPEATRELSTLARVDYTDCVVLDSDLAARRSGEEWARAILEGAPPATRAALRRGWSLLRPRLDSTSDEERILGWELRRRAPDYALLATSTPIGAEAEVLCKREREKLLVGTFMQ